MSLTRQQQTLLLAVARQAIEYGLAHQRPPPVECADYDGALQATRASFVTLHLGERLRGCIGALEAGRPLVVDVAQHAYAAAFSDPRFSPLAADELPGLAIHISVLSPSTPIFFDSEEALIHELHPGIDGLIIAQSGRRATFLPAVWRLIPDRREFLKQLKRKAGISETGSDFLAWRYSAEEFPPSSKS